MNNQPKVSLNSVWPLITGSFFGFQAPIRFLTTSIRGFHHGPRSASAAARTTLLRNGI